MKVYVFTRSKPHLTLGETASCMLGSTLKLLLHACVLPRLAASCLCLVVWGVRHSDKYSVDNQALLGSVSTRNGNLFELLVSDCALPPSIVAPSGVLSLVNVRTGVFSVRRSRKTIFLGWF